MTYNPDQVLLEGDTANLLLLLLDMTKTQIILVQNKEMLHAINQFSLR